MFFDYIKYLLVKVDEKNHSKFGKTNPAFERRFDQNLEKLSNQ